MPCKILLVDDSPTVLDALGKLLANHDDFEVAASVTSGYAALRLLSSQTIDLVLLDMSMPRMNGVETLTQFRARWPELKVLILTSYADDAWVIAALRAGADGYVLKTAPTEHLVRAIRGALVGERPITPEVVARLATAHPLPATQRPTHLAPRELATLKALALGRTNAEIAALQQVSLGTVKDALAKLNAKLGTHSRGQIVAEALRRGLLSAGDQP